MPRVTIVSDDSAKQVEGIQPYIDLGFTYLMFHCPGPDQERARRLYAAAERTTLYEIRARHGLVGEVA